MSTLPMPAAPTSVSDSPDTRSPRRSALILLFALLLIALAARTFFLIWEPPFVGFVDYDVIAPLGDAFWAMNLYVGGPSFAVTWVALAIFVALLARGRSAALTLASAVMIGLGGIVFALVVTGEVLPFAFAADPGNFTEAEGRAIFDVLNADLGLLIPTILATQGVVALGVLITLIVALVTQTLPRWMSVAGLIYLVVFAVVPFDELPRAVTIASDLVQTLLVAGIGWYGLRAGLTSPASDALAANQSPGGRLL